MSTLKTLKNGLLTQMVIGKYLTRGVANAIKNRNDDIARRKRALEVTSKYSSELLGRLGVNISVVPTDFDLSKRNYFMVCNHMSYVDILVLSTWNPAVFVTSVEMEKTFFLGDMAKLGGSFFVNRINRRKMKAEVEQLKNLVEKGLNVFIFPEGTSTNGMSGILPFKKSLFRVPFQADIPILPICLKYKAVNGEPFSEANMDRVTWYDDMTFAPHLGQLMGLRDLQVSIEPMTPLNPSDYKDHGELCLKAQDLIKTAYGNPSEWAR